MLLSLLFESFTLFLQFEKLILQLFSSFLILFLLLDELVPLLHGQGRITLLLFLPLILTAVITLFPGIISFLIIPPSVIRPVSTLLAISFLFWPPPFCRM